MSDRDSICSNNCHYWVGRVSHPVDMGRASTYVCDDLEHQEDAADWVRELTGTRGEFVAFAEPRGWQR